MRKEGYINGPNTRDIKPRFHLNTARTGLRILLSSTQKRKYRVGVQVFTCHTVFEAINNAGHEIVFLDITNKYGLDMSFLQEKIGSIDVLIVTHTFGFPDQIRKIKEIAEDKIIIEDCSHSYLSLYEGKATGKLFDASVFSTGIGKFPPIGAGGFVYINSPEKFPNVENKTASLSEPSFFTATLSYFRILALSIFMKPPLYGLITFRLGKTLDSKYDLVNKKSFVERTNYRWATRLLLSNKSIFFKMKKKQKSNVDYLNSLISDLKYIQIVPMHKDANNYIYPVLVKNRDSLYKNLYDKNIEAGKHFHQSLNWAEGFGYIKGSCPNAESVVKQILTIPVHFGVSKRRINQIAEIIKKHDDCC